jgi:hypothetical protein
MNLLTCDYLEDWNLWWTFVLTISNLMIVTVNYCFLVHYKWAVAFIDIMLQILLWCIKIQVCQALTIQHWLMDTLPQLCHLHTCFPMCQNVILQSSLPGWTWWVWTNALKHKFQNGECAYYIPLLHKTSLQNNTLHYMTVYLILHEILLQQIHWCDSHH